MAADFNTTDGMSRTHDYDALAAQLATLREDMAKLASSAGSAMGNVAQVAGDRVRSLGSDVGDAVSSAASSVVATERAAQGKLEAAVQSNPLVAIGLASVAGYLLGALVRR